MVAFVNNDSLAPRTLVIEEMGINKGNIRLLLLTSSYFILSIFKGRVTGCQNLAQRARLKVL